MAQRYVVDMAKRARAGRIFLDYLRNDRKATAVAPLTPRARPGAPVSMPLNWLQLRSGLDPTRFTVRTAPAIIRRSGAGSEYSSTAQPLAPAIQRLVGKGRSRRARPALRRRLARAPRRGYETPGQRV